MSKAPQITAPRPRGRRLRRSSRNSTNPRHPRDGYEADIEPRQHDGRPNRHSRRGIAISRALARASTARGSSGTARGSTAAANAAIRRRSPVALSQQEIDDRVARELQNNHQENSQSTVAAAAPQIENLISAFGAIGLQDNPSAEFTAQRLVEQAAGQFELSSSGGAGPSSSHGSADQVMGGVPLVQGRQAPMASYQVIPAPFASQSPGAPVTTPLDAPMMQGADVEMEDAFVLAPGFFHGQT